VRISDGGRSAEDGGPRADGGGRFPERLKLLDRT
jgi:hypothetical protein